LSILKLVILSFLTYFMLSKRQYTIAFSYNEPDKGYWREVHRSRQKCPSWDNPGEPSRCPLWSLKYKIHFISCKTTSWLTFVLSPNQRKDSKEKMPPSTTYTQMFFTKHCKIRKYGGGLKIPHQLRPDMCANKRM